MPVKNKNRQSNSGYEGVITGLNDEEKKVLEDAGIGGGGTPILDLSSYYNRDTNIISQEGMSLLTNKILNNEIVGISLGGEFSCMLLDGIYGATIDFLSRVIGEYGRRVKVLIAMEDGKVSQKTEYASLTLPSTSPTSQLIPSITTTNTQQNLTIGDGLTIENGALKATGSGGGGKSVPPTLNLTDFETGGVRTTITEEEKTNLENGLYNQVIFPGLIPDDFQIFMPAKLIGDKSFDVHSFAQFNYVIRDDTFTINALSLYSYTFGEKDNSGNYPITIEKLMDMPMGGSGGGSGSGGGDIWYEISSISNSTITQDQYNELTNLINADKLAGIRVNNEGYFTLFAVIDGNYIFVGYNMSIGLHYANISPDLSTKESYTQLVMFNEKPTSQVIPSFSPIHNAQENLTIGNGLEIKNGALQTTIPPLPADASSKTYTLKAINGVLTWVEG